MNDRSERSGNGGAFDDDRLARLVADVFDHIEPVPDDALQVAYAAIGMSSLSDELATLVFDSAADGDLVLMRSSAQEYRQLTYEQAGLSLDLELHDDGVTIVGLIDAGDTEPSGHMVIEVEGHDGPTASVPVDDHGRFRVVGPPGEVRLRIPGRLVTPWITRHTD